MNTDNTCAAFDSTVSLVVWDQAAALSRVKGKDVRLKRLIMLFLDDAPARMADLREAIAAEELQDAGFIAHEIKGVAGNLGGTSLMKSLSACESACAKEELEKTKQLIPECISQFERLENEFRSYVQSDP